MPINFMPNDPLAQNGPPLREQSPRPDRDPNLAGFTFSDVQPEAVSQPGTPGFLFWQCREAALAAMDAWEPLDSSVTRWARATPTPNRLKLLQNAGIEPNAYYDGDSVSFFEFTTGTKTTFSGQSTDVVAHEVGHALLDQMRPDLWAANLPEPAAFHEGFADCVAMLTALADQATRQALLAVTPNLDAANFLEAVMEDLSDGARRLLGATHPAAEPRRALNTFQWQLPETLPHNGPAHVLTSEVHSLGRLISGSFYDTLRNIFSSLPSRDEAALAAATTTAGRLLIAATRNAPAGPRFFRAVGRAMVIADEAQNGGANHLAIRNAFAGHGIALGSAAMLAPTAALAGRAPRIAAAGTTVLSAATRRDLLRRIAAPANARLAVETVTLGDQPVGNAVFQREVSLDDVDERLAGVVALASESTLVGASGPRAAILGALPQASVTTDEVHTFARMLLENGQIALGSAAAGQGPTRRRRSAIAAGAPSERPTHVIRTRGGRKVLTRVRFACPSPGFSPG